MMRRAAWPLAGRAAAGFFMTKRQAGMQLIHIGGVVVQVVRKAIKHLHLGVYPPLGQVRISVPLRVTDEAARQLVLDKLGWIKRHQAKIAARQRPAAQKLVSGELHYFLGQPYRLEVIYHARKKGRVALHHADLELHVPLGASAAQRGLVLQRWYRQQLTALLPAWAEKWSAAMGVRASEWRVKKMKTKWGTCNIRARRIWLNLELAKQPIHCVEYVLVHELAHLIERRHDARFKAVMDQHCPHWRACRKELNSVSLAHAAWGG
jgi:predicted metal-dependent hydrolase